MKVDNVDGFEGMPWNPLNQVRRYERENPGELIHIDIKKLGRRD